MVSCHPSTQKLYNKLLHKLLVVMSPDSNSPICQFCHNNLKHYFFVIFFAGDRVRLKRPTLCPYQLVPLRPVTYFLSVVTSSPVRTLPYLKWNSHLTNNLVADHQNQLRDRFPSIFPMKNETMSSVIVGRRWKYQLEHVSIKIKIHFALNDKKQ